MKGPRPVTHRYPAGRLASAIAVALAVVVVLAIGAVLAAAPSATPVADAARGGVVFAPGSEFLPQRRDRASRGMRLSVAQAGPEAIRKGIEALAGVVRAHQTTDPAARQAAGVRV